MKLSTTVQLCTLLICVGNDLFLVVCEPTVVHSTAARVHEVFALNVIDVKLTICFILRTIHECSDVLFLQIEEINRHLDI